MEYIVNGLLILVLGALYFLAIRYLRRKGTCAGCSGCKSHGEASSCHSASGGCGDGCGSRCAHCAHCSTHCGSPVSQDDLPTEAPPRD